MLRTRGDVAGGEQILQSFAEGRPDGAEKVHAHIALALYQAKTGRLGAAITGLERVRPAQSDAVEVDRAIARLYYFNRVWPKALGAYEHLLQSQPNDRHIRLTMAECRIKLNQFNDAASLVEAIVAESGASYGTEMLSAEILHGGADGAWARGQREQAQRLESEARDALGRAVRFRPRNPAPHIRRAQWLKSEFTRTGQESLLDDALLSLNRAEEAQSSSQAVFLARAEILRTRGDVRGAVGELTRLLERSPNNDEAREQLIRMHIEANNIAPALALTDEVIARDPRNALWLERKGDLHILEGNIREAVNAYQLAHQYEPNSDRVTKFANAALALDKPDFYHDHTNCSWPTLSRVICSRGL